MILPKKAVLFLKKIYLGINKIRRCPIER